MNEDILKGQWKQVQGDVRKNFGKLTDDDMEQIGGSVDKLMGKIQERYGYTKEQAGKEWDNFWNSAERSANKTADDVKRATR